MKRFFPLLCLILSAACVVAVLPRLLDIFIMLQVVLPMVTTSQTFVTTVALMYVLAVTGLSFLAGVFLTMAFTVRLVDKGKPNE